MRNRFMFIKDNLHPVMKNIVLLHELGHDTLHREEATRTGGFEEFNIFEMQDNVYKKLNKYDGSWNSNVSTASSKTNAKISELRSEQSRYETYATDLIDLRDECKEVDKAVKSKVSSLTASFKEAHGIRNSKVENAISYFFTGLGNETAFGRWLGGKKDEFDSGMNYFKDSIKEWYNYEGGKELITGVLVGLLEVAIGVLAIVGAILSGGALLVIIAGVVGGIIAVANGVANI